MAIVQLGKVKAKIGLHTTHRHKLFSQIKLCMCFWLSKQIRFWAVKKIGEPPSPLCGEIICFFFFLKHEKCDQRYIPPPSKSSIHILQKHQAKNSNCTQSFNKLSLQIATDEVVSLCLLEPLQLFLCLSHPSLLIFPIYRSAVFLYHPSPPSFFSHVLVLGKNFFPACPLLKIRRIVLQTTNLNCFSWRCLHFYYQTIWPHCGKTRTYVL